MNKFIRSGIALTLLTLSTTTFAMTEHPWYVSGNVGIFQGTFNSQYNDTVDIIPQNIRETIQQNSYMGGVAIGYSKLYRNEYLLGGEISGNFATYHANFAAGASSTAFSDASAINGYMDLSFVPGFYVTDTVALYAKAGFSIAWLSSTLNSPAGFSPVMSVTNSNPTAYGAVFGLGVKKFLADNATVFAEYDYHDYATATFNSFTNFATTYSHTSHVYSQSLAVGASYYFW